MKIRPIFVSIVLLIFLSTFLSLKGDTETQIIQPGEKLVYEVSYFGIKLGTIKVVIEGEENLSSDLTYRVKALIDSYKGIPFFSVKTIYKSWLDPTLSYSHKFVGNTKFMSDKWSYQKLLMHYDKNKLINEMWTEKRLNFSDTVKTGKKWNDGCSLFYLARRYTDLKRNIRIPTVIGRDTVYTEINFVGERDKTKIDAVDYPVKTIYFRGNADWEGIYGLSGKFEGWFSDDAARVPIFAKMNVIVGRVNIELIKWTRDGWSPPRAN